MSDKMRWRYDDTHPVQADVDPDTPIYMGDLLWLDRDDAKPASLLQPDTAWGAPMKVLFANNFLGVAMQRCPIGEVCPIRVATTGVFEFECLASKFELGDLIGPAQQDDRLLNQQVAKVGHPDWAIGRVVRREPTPATRVLVAICSTVIAGGVGHRG